MPLAFKNSTAKFFVFPTLQEAITGALRLRETVRKSIGGIVGNTGEKPKQKLTDDGLYVCECCECHSEEAEDGEIITCRTCGRKCQCVGCVVDNQHGQ